MDFELKIAKGWQQWNEEDATEAIRTIQYLWTQNAIHLQNYILQQATFSTTLIVSEKIIRMQEIIGPRVCGEWFTPKARKPIIHQLTSIITIVQPYW